MIYLSLFGVYASQSFVALALAVIYKKLIFGKTVDCPKLLGRNFIDIDDECAAQDELHLYKLLAAVTIGFLLHICLIAKWKGKLSLLWFICGASTLYWSYVLMYYFQDNKVFECSGVIKSTQRLLYVDIGCTRTSYEFVGQALLLLICWFMLQCMKSLNNEERAANEQILQNLVNELVDSRMPPAA